jgi:hypothetical protein
MKVRDVEANVWLRSGRNAHDLAQIMRDAELRRTRELMEYLQKFRNKNVARAAAIVGQLLAFRR